MGLQIILENYQTSAGQVPFDKWLVSLDKTLRNIIRARLNRIRVGNFGDCTPIKGSPGLYELRIHVGAGYRIYFGKDANGNLRIVLFYAGPKGSQDRDIERAKKYLAELRGQK